MCKNMHLGKNGQDIGEKYCGLSHVTKYIEAF